ncbi:hypothetical protein FGIG_08860 [Fasciola gigantica]|uniref:Uncharacterized protein n=1 Tax=Fasciola gigantica TaxID=46835 RepID=A0A504Z0I5_FASGI|nr:hypothetical protein FGIG_08860 [Fasciola gigantica]
MWVGITWGMQIIAAFLALHVAQIWWSFRPTIYHASRYKLALEISSARFSSMWPKPNSFQSDLRVSTWLGFLIETTGVFVDFALASVFACAIGRWNKHHQNSVFCSAVACSDTSFLSNRNASDECRADYHALLTPSRLQFWSSFALRLSISLFLTAKWIGLTGLYVNPANAFIQSWGLGDVSSWSHICVYWLGPFCGVWLSAQFERWLTQFMPEGSDSVISQLPKTPRVATLATQTVQETADLTETNSATSTSRRGLSNAQWLQNVRLRCLFSPIFDPHSVERETSPCVTVNGFNLVSRFTRSFTRSTDAIR